MHTVAELPEYLAAAKKAGMTEAERIAVVDVIAANPQAGGYRVITYYAHDDMPVFLVTVFAKSRQANLTQAQKNELKKGKMQ